MKDDPLKQRPGYRTATHTLWLEPAGMAEARQNFWEAYKEVLLTSTDQEGLDQRTWNIAWAAAVSAMSYVLEGRIAPKP